MSMKTEAAPSAPARSPSSTSTSNVSRSPSSFGDFSTTTASVTPAFALLNTDTVALGGVLAKLSGELLLHSSSRCAVNACPAERTGRSAKTMALGEMPSSVSFCPSSLAPRALSTIIEGTTAACCGWPMVLAARVAAGRLALAVVSEPVRAETPPQRVDEDGGRAVGLADTALQDLDVEGQPLALELGRGQLDHGVADAGAVLGEHRHGRVRRILGEASGVPDRDHVGRHHVADAAHRTAGEERGARQDAVEHELLAVELGAAGVQHDQGLRILPRRGHADRLLGRRRDGVGGGRPRQRLGGSRTRCQSRGQNQGSQKAAPLLCVHYDWSFLPRAFAAAPCIREARAGEKGALALSPAAVQLTKPFSQPIFRPLRP